MFKSLAACGFQTGFHSRAEAILGVDFAGTAINAVVWHSMNAAQRHWAVVTSWLTSQQGLANLDLSQ
jgi:hypothetical protein